MNKPERIVVMVLVGLIFTSLASFAAEQQGKPVRPVANPSKASQDNPSVATAVFEQVSKSVVIVEALSSAEKVQGSGVAYDTNRLFGPVSDSTYLFINLFDMGGNNFSRVVTNAHVVTNASRVSVLQGGKRYRAEVSYVNDEFDLALLIVFGILPVSPPFSSAQLKVGEKVFAIGSPLGLENTISEGIVSGKRERNGVLLLQTTAAVSHGSSGGGLFDAKGRFIGVTTFKLVDGENLNFAVDAALVTEIDSAQQAAMALVSCKIPEHFSKDKIDALTEWLLKAPGGISEKLSTMVKLQKSFEVCKDSEQIFEQFSKDQGSKTTKTTTKTRNKPEIVAMVCTMTNSEGQNRYDETFELDYTNKMVNGYPAQFTNAEIWWRETRGNTKYYLTLNRYSASIQISTERFPSLFFGKCSPAAQRKF